MALILNIETATKSCSVAIGKDGKTVASAELHGLQSHASNLTLLIEKCLNEIGKKLTDLDAIAVSEGPGSYTGLRIGLSTAKGICYTLEKPMIAVSTLAALANATKIFLDSETETETETETDSETDSETVDIVFCPMIDARRMEVYTAIYDSEINILKEIQPLIIENEDYWESYFGNNQTVIFSGDGAEKCREIITNKNAQFITQLNDAKGMVEISEQQFQAKDFADVAYSSPFYLKSPNITKPRNKLHVQPKRKRSIRSNEE
jgi:tRNA threonylcarbamoyladenosine biosynthesis protein TsaB